MAMNDRYMRSLATVTSLVAAGLTVLILSSSPALAVAAGKKLKATGEKCVKNEECESQICVAAPTWKMENGKRVLDKDGNRIANNPAAKECGN
jgi:uncharacterized membrane protein